MKISCVLSEEEVKVDHMERVEFHMIDDHGWVEYALCAEDEPDSLFVQGAAQRQVRMRCMECPVRLECLADALQSQMSYGVWGGLTERERRVILRVYPEKTDWSEWLMHSRDPLAVELRKPRVPQSLSMKHLRTNAKALREASLSVAARG
jgi:WhiB family redox-sensing transcriptional regulator